MFQENEIIMFLIGICTVVYITTNRKKMDTIPSARLLLASFFPLLFAWMLTLLEHVVLFSVLNFIEHSLYMISSLLFLVWVVRAGSQKEKNKE